MLGSSSTTSTRGTAGLSGSGAGHGARRDRRDRSGDAVRWTDGRHARQAAAPREPRRLSVDPRREAPRMAVDPGSEVRLREAARAALLAAVAQVPIAHERHAVRVALDALRLALRRSAPRRLLRPGE